jgi:hypothetical protein
MRFLKRDSSLVFGWECTGYRLRGRREVDRQDVEALFGESNAVPLFAIGDGEHLAAAWQERFAADQKFVGLLADLKSGVRSVPCQ